MGAPPTGVSLRHLAGAIGQRRAALLGAGLVDQEHAGLDLLVLDLGAGGRVGAQELVDLELGVEAAGVVGEEVRVGGQAGLDAAQARQEGEVEEPQRLLLGLELLLAQQRGRRAEEDARRQAGREGLALDELGLLGAGCPAP